MCLLSVVAYAGCPEIITFHFKSFISQEKYFAMEFCNEYLVTIFKITVNCLLSRYFFPIKMSCKFR